MFLKQAFKPMAITGLLVVTTVPERYLLLIIVELKLFKQYLPATMQIESFDVDLRFQTELEDSLIVFLSFIAYQKQALVV